MLGLNRPLRNASVSSAIMISLAAGALARDDGKPGNPRQVEPARDIRPGDMTDLVAPPQPVKSGLPSGAEIHQNYLKKIGGRRELSQIVSRHAKGTVEVKLASAPDKPAETIAKGTIDQMILRPGKARILSTLERVSPQPEKIGVLDQGTDGTTVWSIDPRTGVQILQGAEREEFLKSSSLDSELNLLKDYPNAYTTDLRAVDGLEVYTVVFSKATGDQVTRTYFRETGLLRSVERSVAMPGGKTNAVMMYSDYRPVGNVHLPYQMVVKAGPLEQITKFETVRINEDIPADQFVAPDAVVKALKDQPKPAMKPDAKPGEVPLPVAPKPQD